MLKYKKYKKILACDHRRRGQCVASRLLCINFANTSAQPATGRIHACFFCHAVVVSVGNRCLFYCCCQLNCSCCQAVNAIIIVCKTNVCMCVYMHVCVKCCFVSIDVVLAVAVCKFTCKIIFEATNPAPASCCHILTDFVAAQFFFLLVIGFCRFSCINDR